MSVDGRKFAVQISFVFVLFRFVLKRHETKRSETKRPFVSLSTSRLINWDLRLCLSMDASLARKSHSWSFRFVLKRNNESKRLNDSFFGVVRARLTLNYDVV